MMSASAISAQIRAKKKKMKDDPSSVPVDATDEMVMKNKEPGEMLSENDPKDHDEDPMLGSVQSANAKSAPHEDMAPDPHVMGEDMDMEKAQRKTKLRAMMMRMGK